MSTDYSLACLKCKKHYWVAQDGLSGFTFYSGEKQCMAGINKFLGEHVLHGKVVLLPEYDVEDFEQVDWPELK